MFLENQFRKALDSEFDFLRAEAEPQWREVFPVEADRSGWTQGCASGDYRTFQLLNPQDYENPVDWVTIGPWDGELRCTAS